ncbi:MAG: hypothetical protein AMJ92_00775 [candidate division Zixibacteria bacterium SM23_81]|nr:MAG: hypothetical protein AMJ92_00775 [candidate division Zixibacteria bacterium SM23_81]
MAIGETRRNSGIQQRSELSGLLNIDKPSGWTSHDVVAKVRRALRIQKIGHTGTLDPIATGVLLLCVGRATKMARFLVGLEKEYRATIMLGGESDTLDAQGQISLSNESPKVSMAEMRKVCDRFLGTQEQIPPMFSAVKHRGQPLYRLARQGKTVARHPRPVFIRSLEICHIDLPQVILQISCSSGTYIRVLAADIGKELGCGAYLLELKRTRLGPFRDGDALPLARVVELAQLEQLEQFLLPVGQGLITYPRFVVRPREVSRVIHGQPMTREIFREVDIGAKKGDAIRIEDTEGKLLAMAELLVHTDQLTSLTFSDRICRSLQILS